MPPRDTRAAATDAGVAFLSRKRYERIGAAPSRSPGRVRDAAHEPDRAQEVDTHMSKRIAIGGIWHETNTFAAGHTELADFRRYQYAEGAALLDRYQGTGTELGGMIPAARARSFELLPAVFAAAVPSATIARSALDALCETMQARLSSFGSIDGLLLVLHGAAASEGIDDADAYILEKIREVLPRPLPIAATFDFHANLSEAMVAGADLLVGYDTFPHVDMAERGAEAAALLDRLLDDPRRPARTLVKVPLLSVPQKQATDREPARSIMAALHEAEARPGVWCGSVALGFPYADAPHLGASVLVYADDPATAETEARRVADAIWTRRHAFDLTLSTPDDAVAEALAQPRGPVVLVDPADNVGGGSAGDGTVILEALIRHRARGAVVVIADAEAVAVAEAAGEGGGFEAPVGARADDRHGSPVPVQGVVQRLGDGRYVHRGSYMTGYETSMGRCAVVDADGVRILLTSLRTMPFDAEQLRCVGVEPADQRIIVVKSASAWRAAYESVARHVIFVDTPGVCASNLAHFDYRRRPVPAYPLET